jgi:hypothetical protein
MLDLYNVKADVSMTTVAAAAQKPMHIVQTLNKVGECMESTAKVNQDHLQAGCVYEFITRSYASKVSLDLDTCLTLHRNPALAFSEWTRHEHGGITISGRMAYGMSKQWPGGIWYVKTVRHLAKCRGHQ